MADVDELYTDADLAERFGISVRTVQERCRTGGWPHLRPARNSWRFTADMVAEIERMITQRFRPTKPPGREGKRLAAPDAERDFEEFVRRTGLTRRSARYHFKG